MTRTSITTILITFCLGAAFAMTKSEYAKIESKAARFFANEEWASANAMYLLMLDEKPRVASTYAKAVVVDIMAGDTLQALDMIPKSMEYQISIDSVLTDVKNISFSIGQSNLYEKFLLKIKKTYPWLARVADNYLMKYYSFRQNGPELIAYANTMLAGLPDNKTFLRMLAKGKLLDGQTREAVEIWQRIDNLYPNDYETILDLANCYDALGDKSEALKWMERARQIYPTPYVESRIATLSRP